MNTVRKSIQFPEDIDDAIKQVAKINSRSFSGEVVDRMRKSLNLPVPIKKPAKRKK